MDLLQLRGIASRDDAATKVTGEFFDALAARRAMEARGQVKTDFRWFGDPVADEAWRTKFNQFFAKTPIVVEKVWSVNPEYLRLAPPDLEAEFFDGPLSDTDAVAFANLRVGGDLVTAAAIVDCTKPGAAKIRRILELTPYVEYLRARGAEINESSEVS